MKRRSFLKTSSALTLPIALNGFGVGYLSKSALSNFIDPESDRVLVLIQLDGGNDGLNTLIPIDQYSLMAKHRSSILIPENQVLGLTDTCGLHPAMTGFRNLFNDGKIAAVQNVAYPNQNRSHFRSTDIWQSGSSAGEFVTSGWLGRMYDRDHAEFPKGYPNEDYPDPFAITLQYTVSETCQGLSSNYSMAIVDPFNAGQIDEATLSALPDTNFGFEMSFLIDSIGQTNAYSQVIVDTAERGASLSPLYNPNDALAEQLKSVAMLISGGLQTKVYVVRIGGFDTHANQVSDGEATTVGFHAGLLQSLSDAITAFQDDIERLGVAQRVLGMTFSEFGRQIGANDSFGTDHGEAAPLFLFGSCVNGGIIGQNTVLPDELEQSQGVAMQVDYRNVYASVLAEWFDLSPEVVAELLLAEFQPLGLVEGCQTTSTDSLRFSSDPYEIAVYPNPIADSATIKLNSPGGRMKVELYDILGREVALLADRNMPRGKQLLEHSFNALPSGQYLLRVTGERGSHATSISRQ